ncbi:bifunctional methylenetetrahydrofolate dehydrogenase/methenyltetrahydrofolate cyclohydrolase [Lactobacillus amylolyticus]|uniref:Bifunctional protein FolD n=1 Tax=Lactobacillus amylolyticus DSM 11664 TaxID=585524 RepID=D4YS98_9LACO|nr:bifunctional methylenetetrahydrofolate dehydrogenase/methenyltetrahydrofolate cyclohydrolase [Lactobacillus amylolyticus]ARD06594.1 bifunctional methylenetetrahydrofolate dehydrogenase/methenyltetrahydrofolate cyclohydrolase [Lactobacillus amylolyticus]EFG55913.1 tetrahydrofolate dehydrogenase/cyclohydrolase, NAD(P)-binding domain protein [Lactobacillus amylolyticus DSM 11664]KRL19443.1 bifunctional methylenetetrahydrofolate dehydrogenase methylenetetrahydrofolate cyclohydrolase [Lactobacillu
MGQILDGKAFANLKADKLKEKVKKLKADGIQPLFCVINIGDDSASKIYVRTKKRRAKKIGIEQKIYQLPANEQESDVIKLIDQLNVDPKVNGIMVQLPVPDQIDENHLLSRIDPEKDVDGLTPASAGRLWQGTHFVEPATAAGIIGLLEHYQIDLDGKNMVIIGRSNIVGKPLAALALEKNATVSLLHHHTQNLKEYTQKADIIVSAAGQANLITADMIKPGAVVIDVGINHVNGHLVGDVAFDEVKDKASWITPVPGGVGPLTVEYLMEQVVKLTRRANGRQ